MPIQRHQELPRSLAELPSYPTSVGDHRSTKVTSPPWLFSAAELAAGDSFHLRRPINHPEDRLGLAVPSPPLDAREAPPFVDGDRRSPAPIGQKRGEGGKKRSNLTSGPSGPTVSDPRDRSLCLSEGANSRVRLLYCESVFPSESFSFLVLFKNRDLTKL